MREISVRDFQREASRHLKEELPVILTYYNKPRWVVSNYTVEETTFYVNVDTSDDGEDGTQGTVDSLGACMVPGCKKEATEMGYMYVEGVSVDDTDLIAKPMCKFHSGKSKVGK